MKTEYVCQRCGYTHKVEPPKKEPQTHTEVEEALIEMGFDVVSANKSNVVFWYRGNHIIYFLKKKWASGKGIEDGRGWDHLVTQITK
jgi:hypothetical protein